MCPDCGQQGLVINAKYYGDQDVWRRYQCPDGHRWSHRDGIELRPGVSRGRLNAAAVRLVLESRETSCLRMARRLGFSVQAVRRTRLGERNAGVLPEIPRWTLEECRRLDDRDVPVKRRTPHLCPHCAARGAIIESRMLFNGSRRKRRECPSGHRWTEWVGERPPAGKQPGGRDPRFRYKGERLTEDQVRLILESRHIGYMKMGQIVGRSREVVRHIRLGLSYRDVAPEVPRWSSGEVVVLSERRKVTLTCRDCIHWDSACTMGFPDAKEAGITFARDCSSFQRADEPAAA